MGLKTHKMKTFKPHPYEFFKRKEDSSEYLHLKMLDSFTRKESFERFATTAKEKAELKKRMYNYPNKNHKPIPPNN